MLMNFFLDPEYRILSLILCTTVSLTIKWRIYQDVNQLNPTAKASKFFEAFELQNYYTVKLFFADNSSDDIDNCNYYKSNYYKTDETWNLSHF